MSESTIQAEIRLAMARHSTLFRVNVGQAWTGNRIEKHGRDVLIHDARPFSTGLPPGFADLFGWVRQGDVARFLAIECKSPTGRPSDQQKCFLAAVRAAGGLSGIARSVDDAMAILRNEQPPA